MRTLIILRGAPGCGKTTWIKENGLKPYALSADDLRLLCQSPVLQVDGTTGISQSNDKYVWKTLFQLLEIRMRNGEFTVIDATNSKTSEMKRYKDLCDTYRYRIFCVDFTDIPIDVTKKRNANREITKRVPEEVIDKMYSRFATQKIPSGIKVIRPDELDSVFMKPIDLSGYTRIHHIGDIHGCYTALKKYFDENGGIKDDEFYIFTGDYIDRGIENVQVVQFLLSIKDSPNVLLLEGNHERWLKIYGNGGIGRSQEFENVTRPQIERAKISKKDIRQLYRKLAQCAYYKYDDKIFLVTHGGLSTLPENLSFVATEQMIKGVGSYNDFESIAETFKNTTPSNVYQIHGHRNTKHLPIRVNDRVFNLEGKVEFGGELRCVQVDKNGIHTCMVQNTVFKVENENQVPHGNNVAQAITELRSNPYIQEKTYGDISSFNFTRKAFYDRAWDEQTVKARGLYIDTHKNKVIARSYEKFFNINERPETKLDRLQFELKFPVTVYVKENGFLGIVSYDEYNDDLLIATKSTLDSQYAQWLKEMFYQKVSSENIRSIKKFVKENNVSFVFECVDMKHDPHVIDYPESKLVLLDIIKNDLEFSKHKYDTMITIAQMFGLEHKEKAYEISNWQDFYDWYCNVLEPDYEYHGREIEGFVIEDSKGFMTKLKLSYYNFWKFMRSVAQEAIKYGYIKKTSALTTPLANEFYAWVRTLQELENRDELPRDICTLRKMFYESKGK